MASTSPQLAAFAEILRCPACGGGVRVGEEVRCQGCARAYPIEDGIPRLYVSDESEREPLTQEIRSFYEETPFPNYEGFESVEDLVRKAEQGRFARLLNDQLPFDGRILEVGCGTGQLTNYLSLAQRQVFGADMTLASLRLGNAFRDHAGLSRAGFYQMNLYQPAFAEAVFDVVLCNGVLCAVADSFAGFRSVARLVKPGGHILVGTYNRFGRWITDTRRALIRLFGERAAALDPHLRGLEGRKRDAWLADQYRHPHETKHTMGQVLRWFRETGFEFVYGVPSPKAFVPFRDDDAIFEPHPAGGRLDHFIAQAQLVLQGSYEGGFFTMIGRRA